MHFNKEGIKKLRGRGNRRSLLFLPAVLLLLFLAVGGPARPAEPSFKAASPVTAPNKEGEALVLATTTSVADSGLLELLLPVFKEKTGIEVLVLSRGTGQALELGQRGDVDLLLVHDRPAELRLLKAGYFTDRYDVMYNDYLIVGPAADPAKIKGTGDAVAALSSIAEGSHTFVSRGDDSGTHRLELKLWAKAGIADFGSWYFAVGQGMGDTLRLAGELQGYTLTDRSSYLLFKDRLELEIMVQGDPLLYNQYGIMAVNPERHPHVRYKSALKMIDFMLSPQGQQLIASFQRGGEPLFFPGRAIEGAGIDQPEREAEPSSLQQGLGEAFYLIINFDPSLWRIVLLSLQVSGLAVLLGALAGVPLGVYLGLKPAERTRYVSKFLYTLMGLPPVVAGLVLYLLFSRTGPLGALGLLFTPGIMVIAQFVLSLPIITGLTMLAIRSQDKAILETALTLGASRLLTAWTVVQESRPAIFGAVVAGLGRVMAEVGAVMMVGGNIAGRTRVMTTAIVLETGKGNFELAIGLGLVLLFISFVINSLLYRFQGGGRSSVWL